GPQGTHVRIRCGWTSSGVGIIDAMGVVRSHVSVESAPSMWLLLTPRFHMAFGSRHVCLRHADHLTVFSDHFSPSL
ncbi:unnamed protein product, partial [Musa textilis]